MRTHVFILVAAFLWFVGAPVRAAEDPKAVLDKAVKAMGGDKVTKPAGFSWKSKGKLNFDGNESDFTIAVTVQGIDHLKSEFEGDFGGNKIQAVAILNGDKGWRTFGGMTMPLDGDGLAMEKRNAYLQIASSLVAPLQSKEFKISSTADEQVDGKPAVGLKVVGPDGKDFTLYFDKESGLPVKQVAKVSGFTGEEFTQESTFSNYKDFGGVKRATKVEHKRDGQPFVVQELTEFKAMDKVPDETFAEPK